MINIIKEDGRGEKRRGEERMRSLFCFGWTYLFTEDIQVSTGFGEKLHHFVVSLVTRGM